MTAVTLHRIDPAHNMARFFRRKILFIQLLTFYE